MKNSNSDICPKCNGLGFITSIKDGDLYAERCTCLEKEIVNTRLKFAHIPKAYEGIRVSDFKTTVYSNQESIALAKNARDIAKNYILNYDKIKEMGKGLYLYSLQKGSGKTMLAIAIGNALISTRNEQVKYATVPDILTEIKATYSNESTTSESELIDSLRRVKVLIMDDIGTEKLTGWSNEIMYQIINERIINKLVTIFTSNTHISQLKHDERIISRINKMSIQIQMPEESIRDVLAESENARLTKELLGM